MFRQLYLRLTGLILAVTLLAVLIAGGISIFSATQFYRNQFSDSLADLAGSDFPQTLHTILTAEQEDAERIAQLQWALESCAARLSLDENRTAFVLNARDASVVVPSALQAQTVTINVPANSPEE